MSAKISPKQTQANRGERGDLLFFASFSDNFFAWLIPPPAKLGNLECPSLLDEDESSLSSKETRIKKKEGNVGSSSGKFVIAGDKRSPQS